MGPDAYAFGGISSRKITQSYIKKFLEFLPRSSKELMQVRGHETEAAFTMNPPGEETNQVSVTIRHWGWDDLSAFCHYESTAKTFFYVTLLSTCVFLHKTSNRNCWALGHGPFPLYLMVYGQIVLQIGVPKSHILGIVGIFSHPCQHWKIYIYIYFFNYYYYFFFCQAVERDKRHLSVVLIYYIGF